MGFSLLNLLVHLGCRKGGVGGEAPYSDGTELGTNKSLIFPFPCVFFCWRRACCFPVRFETFFVPLAFVFFPYFVTS